MPSSRKVAGDKPQKDKDIKFVVHGQVLYSDKKPVIDVKVIAFDQDIAREDLLGEAITDQDGNYQITYSESQFRRTEKEIGGPDLIVRVYSAEGKVMAQSKRKGNAKQEETVDLTVSSEELFTVSGIVRRSDSRLVTGALVHAYDQDLRKKQLLGKAVTDAAGHYSIAYTSRKFLRAEKTSADLYVVVVDAKGKTLVSSEVLFNAPVEATVDLTLPIDRQTLSEFEILLEDILPLLAGQGKGSADLKIAELEDKDMAFLSRESDQQQERIAFLLAAVKAALSTPSSSGVKVKSYVSKSQLPAIPVEAFYGWFRQGLPTDLNELLNQSDDILRRALVASLRANIIPDVLGDALDSILARLQQLAAERLLKPGEPDGKASLSDLLSSVLPDPQKQRALASLLVSHQGTSEAFWEALRGTPGFGKAKIGQIQTTLQLGALTGNHLPLVRELQRMGQQDPELKELRGFARLDVADWENVLRRPQANGTRIGFPTDMPGQDDSAKIASYAEKLNHYIENTFPTAVIARQLEKDNQVGSPLMVVQDDLKTFFDNNPAFEFGTTPVDLYLSQDRQQRLKGIKQPEEVTVQLKNMQRVFKITPHFEQINALLADNLHSSQAIVHMGKREFVEKHAGTFGGEEPAMIAYTLAEHIHLMALTLFAKHSVAFNSSLPYVIAGDPTERMTRRCLISLSSSDLRTLFGPLDLCDCEHCRSLYSPSAYLVDILKFLNDRPEESPKSPLDVLLDRRPDIANIELTCENTDTPLPYVDLVNEVLEEALMPTPGGHLDWYSFDERTDQKLNRDVTIKQKIFNSAKIPTALSFRGMPAPRLWEFEGAQVRFGSIHAAPTDLARLLLVKFLIEYGNDFFISNKPLFRVFSLRHEFPNEFHRLLHSPINTEISIKLSENFFPIFTHGRTMQINLAKLVLGTPKNQTVRNFKISINNSERTSFTSDPLLGGLPTNQNLEALFFAGNKTELKFKLKNAGDLAPTPPVVGDSSPISPDKLLDMLIYLEYKITS